MLTNLSERFENLWLVMLTMLIINLLNEHHRKEIIFLYHHKVEE